LRTSIKIALTIAGVLLVASVAGARWIQQNNQRADDAFDARVARPVYQTRHPRIVVDETHHNFHTSTGRYRPLTRLLTNDGYAVRANEKPFTDRHALDSIDVLVVANAMGWWLPRGARAARNAFTSDEIAVVRNWVENGGALLLVADHYPAGPAAAALANAFGVEMNGGWLLDSTRQAPKAGSPSWVVYDRERESLGAHPILEGRDSTERIQTVITFTGQSLSIPAGATALLQCGPGAVNTSPDRTTTHSARGMAQAVALNVGKGRVVIIGEAAMLTAQVAGSGGLRFGMTWPGTDDRQFALNILHWLSGAL
jgi:hypothetical protein